MGKKPKSMNHSSTTLSPIKEIGLQFLDSQTKVKQ